MSAMSPATAEAVASPPAPGPDQRQLADRVAVDRHRVGDAHHLGDRRGFGDHRRMHALLDAARGALGDPQQLDAIAQFVGRGEIGEADRLDAFDMDRLGVDPRAERQRSQNGELVRGVVAANVEGRVRLGVAEPLGVGETCLERQPVGLHPRENVVAGAVENAIDAPHCIAGERLAQGLDDRNAAADRRLEGERDAAPPRPVPPVPARDARSSPCWR